MRTATSHEKSDKRKHRIVYGAAAAAAAAGLAAGIVAWTRHRGATAANSDTLAAHPPIVTEVTVIALSDGTLVAEGPLEQTDMSAIEIDAAEVYLLES